MVPFLICTLGGTVLLSKASTDFDTARVLLQLFLAICLGIGLLAVIYWGKIKQFVTHYGEQNQSPRRKP